MGLGGWVRVRVRVRVRVGVIGFQPLPRLGAGDGARARPLGLTDLVAPRGVPDLYQAQVLHLVRVRGGVGVGARVGARATVRARVRVRVSGRVRVRVSG